MSATSSAAVPLTSIGTDSPLPGTGAMMAMSANAMPCSPAVAASRCFAVGDAVFMSAQTVPGRAPAIPAASADAASCALLTLSTRSAPRTASASSSATVAGGSATTLGS